MRKRLTFKAIILIAVCILIGCSPYRTYDFTGEGGPGTIDLSGYVKQYEALEWLEANGNEHAFAGNRFENTQAAKEFVQQLYDLGAEQIYISGVLDEDWRLQQEGGPYADTLTVILPADETEKEAILEVYRSECSEHVFNDGDEQSCMSGDQVCFWWD